MVIWKGALMPQPARVLIEIKGKILLTRSTAKKKWSLPTGKMKMIQVVWATRQKLKHLRKHKKIAAGTIKILGKYLRAA